jgi:hypothetical protein
MVFATNQKTRRRERHISRCEREPDRRVCELPPAM